MKINTKLILSLLLVGLIPMLIMTFLSINRSSDALMTSAKDQLEAIRTLKQKNIQRWFTLKKRDVVVYGNNSAVKMAAERFFLAYEEEGRINGPKYQEWNAYHGPKLEQFAEQFNFYDLFFINKNGDIVYTAAKEGDIGLNINNNKIKNSGLAQVCRDVLSGGEFSFSDFAWYNISNEPAAFIAAPMKKLDGTFVGIIAAQISLESINMIMQERTGMGNTGETYIVGSDYKMRSDSYLDPEGHSVNASFEGTVEKNGVKTEATEEAFAGKSETKIIIDYNGNPVVSSFAPIDILGKKWAILAEKDVAEVKEPINDLTLLLVIIAVVLLIAIVIIAFVLARSITNGIKNVVDQIVNLTKSVANGKLDQRGKEDSVGVDFREIITNLNDLINAFMAPLNVTAEYVDRISKGDIPPKITDEYKGDFNEIKNNLNLCIDSVNNMVSDVDILIEAAKSENFVKRADIEKHSGEFRVIVSGINQTLDVVVDKIFWFESILDSIPSPVSVTDMNMNWKFINKAVEEITGTKRKEVVGQHCSNWNADICGTEKCGIEGLRKGRPTSYFTQPGLDMDFKVDTSYIVDQNNEKIGHIEVITDITETSKKAEYDKIEIERLGNNLKTIANGNFELDVNITEPDKYTEDNHKNFKEIYDNLDILKNALEELVNDALMLGNSAVEGQLDIRADENKHQGKYKDIISSVNGTLDNVIGPLNVAAEYVDRISKGDIPPKITDEYKGDFNEIKNNLNLCIDSINLLVNDANSLARNAIYGRLRKRSDESRHNGDFREIVRGVNLTLDTLVGLLDNIPAPLMSIDKDFNIQFMNKTGASLDGKSGKQLEGQKCYDHFKTSQCKTGDCACHMAMQNDDFVTQETDAHPGNHDLEINYSGFPIKNQKNETVGAFEIVLDQTEVKQTMKKVEEEAQKTEKAMKITEKISKYQDIEAEKLTEALNNIANGNLDFEIIAADADNDTQEVRVIFEKIHNALNSTKDAVNNLVDDANSLAHAAVEGDLTSRADAEKHNGDYRKIIEGVNHTLDSVIDPINEALAVLEILATGDLTERMHGDYKGDHQKLKNSINQLGSSLNDALKQVYEAVESSASAAFQISSSAETMATASQEQSSQADEVASAVEEMSRTVTENAMSASKTSEVAESNGKLAEEGGNVVKQTVDKMKDIAEVVKKSAANIQELGKSSQQIGEIISVIDDIADQTNLLALNAAIEAARAGEQGRGFAVVADEVRKLAERTTEATKQIAQMIKGVQSETDRAVEVMNKGDEEVTSGISLADKAGQSLIDIVSGVKETIDMINQIAAASEEQSSTSEEISKNVSAISEVTNESVRQIQDVAHASDDLSKLTDSLRDLVGQFKLSKEYPSSKTSLNEAKGKNGKLLEEHN